MIATHALTMNGRINGELKDTFGSVADELRHRLSRLDGVDRYSLILWALPPGVPLDQVDLSSWPEDYIQCAGSAERMTIELRKVIDGMPHQYVIGRPADSGRQSAEEIIAWDGVETSVQSHEIFDVAQAAELFYYYYKNADSPDSYTRRTLVL